MVMKKDQLASLLESKSFRQGVSFGIVSSAMTVLGMSLGMWSSDGRRKAIVAAIIGLAISNSFADGFSMYMGSYARGDSGKQALTTSLLTAGTELFLPFMFLIPLYMFKVRTAIILNGLFGVLLVAGTGLYVSEINKESNVEKISSAVMYIAVTMVIMAATYGTGLITKNLS